MSIIFSCRVIIMKFPFCLKVSGVGHAARWRTVPRLSWIINGSLRNRLTGLHHPGQGHHHQPLMTPLSGEKSGPLSAHDAPIYSYNCSTPPNPPELLRVELDCHWLDAMTLLCCLIQVVNALCP